MFCRPDKRPLKSPLYFHLAPAAASADPWYQYDAFIEFFYHLATCEYTKFIYIFQVALPVLLSIVYLLEDEFFPGIMVLNHIVGPRIQRWREERRILYGF